MIKTRISKRSKRNKNVPQAYTSEFAIGYQKNKAEAALKLAKELEQTRLKEGRKTVFLTSAQKKI
ncbi:hypothetical protein PL371_05170 [Tenacibaculum maritimum]|nr:hypothetical protein [Tenacibaculum maritimum]MDB0611272.1 hypothetical protein [Tenacibaculum maritimum]